jgi:hypothetical protein
MTDIQRTSDSSKAVRARARRRLAPVPFEQQLALIANRCGAEVALMPDDRVALTGTLDGIGQMLAFIKWSGRYVSSTDPVPTPVAGVFLANIQLARGIQPHAVRQAAPRRKLPRWAFWSIIGGVTTLVGGLVWLAVAIATFIAEHLAVASVIAVGLAVLVAVLVGNRAGGTTITGTFQGKIR